ncbi:MAG: type II toxin-antitoxin system VapC family toxin [Caulobacteraceae bacterium]|nr:type II toxin-antitoxin system VapC family toxin [Caulobacteraceae bacterium]
MTRYLDTSVLVSALINEAASARVRAWFDRQGSSDFVVSDRVVAEFSAALPIKLRMGAIVAEQRAEALTVFGRLSERSFRVLPVERAEFRAAARLADQFALGLRAADALHLAVVLDYGAILCTLDRRLAGAAAELGVTAELL